MELQADEIFRSMYEEYKIQLRTIARHYGIPYDEIDDVVQETFASYYENYSVDNEKRGCILITILRNKCIDYRRKIHYETVSADSNEGRFALDDMTSGFGKDTADKVADRELYDKVRACISEMHSEWQEVIFYCCILQYTSERAGEILGISAIACRSRLLRAREHLKKRLSDYF